MSNDKLAATFGFGPRDCKRGKFHRFDALSGWCVHGCGNREDGRVLNRQGELIHDGEGYTVAELADIRATCERVYSLRNPRP